MAASLFLMHLARKNEKTVAVDLFDRQDLNLENSGKGDLAQFKKNVEQFGEPSTLCIHSGDSTAIDGRFILNMAGGPIRLFSIDGGHTATITCHDLETAETALAPGGVIILDDCFNEDWPDVSTGFHRFFSASRKVVPFAVGANKTFLTTNDMAQKYRNALVGSGVSMSVHEFLGHPVHCFNFRRPPLVNRIEGRIKNMRWWKTVKNFPGIPMLRRTYIRCRPYFSSY